MHIVLLPDPWNIMIVEIYFKIIPLLPFFFFQNHVYKYKMNGANRLVEFMPQFSLQFYL